MKYLSITLALILLTITGYSQGSSDPHSEEYVVEYQHYDILIKDTSFYSPFTDSEDRVFQVYQNIMPHYASVCYAQIAGEQGSRAEKFNLWDIGYWISTQWIFLQEAKLAGLHIKVPTGETYVIYYRGENLYCYNAGEYWEEEDHLDITNHTHIPSFEQAMHYVLMKAGLSLEIQKIVQDTKPGRVTQRK